MKKIFLICGGLLIAGLATAEVQKFVTSDYYPMLNNHKAEAKATEKIEATFLIPEGAFYFGRNADKWKLPGSVILPPYSTVTWKYDGTDAVSYKWEYTDMSKQNLAPTDFGVIESTEKDLTYETGSYNIGYTPKITATFEDGSEATYFISGNYSDEQSYLQVGGHAGNFVYNNMPGLMMINSYGISSYSFKHGTVTMYTDYSQESYVFGNGVEVKEAGVTGLACILPEPAAPYIIDGGVQGLLEFELDDEAEIMVTVRKATKVSNEEYTLGAELGHATLTGAQFKAQGRLIMEQNYLGDILFDKLYQTDADGNEVEVKPLVDTAIAVVFSGWDSSYVKKFGVFSNEQIYTNGKYDEKANARIGTYAMWTGGAYGNTAKAKYKNIAPAMTVHAYFPYVYCETTEIDASVSGAITSLKVDQYNYYADLKIACDGVVSSATQNSGETALNEWIKVVYTKDMSSSRFCNKIDLIIDKCDEKGRSAVVSFIDIDGTKQDILVKQGEVDGVDGIEADNNVTTEYYNLQGVRIANPEKGIYIVKRGNKVYKEIIK